MRNQRVIIIMNVRNSLVWAIARKCKRDRTVGWGGQLGREIGSAVDVNTVGAELL